jgi:hypothetical protein
MAEDPAETLVPIFADPFRRRSGMTERGAEDGDAVRNIDVHPSVPMIRPNYRPPGG